MCVYIYIYLCIYIPNAFGIPITSCLSVSQGVLKSLDVDGASAKLVDYHSPTYSCEDASSSCDISWPEMKRGTRSRS